MSKNVKKHYSQDLKTKETLLTEWLKSTETMHKGHHIAASKNARNHKILGAIAVGLSTIVATALFASLSSSENEIIVILSGMISVIAALLMGIATFLNLKEKSSQHFKAAIQFQAVRREIEEELVRLKSGEPKDSYEHIRLNWESALSNAIPLPTKIYDKVSEFVGDN